MLVNGVEPKAFSLPPVRGVSGRTLVPVVVSCKQGQELANNDDEALVGVGAGKLQAGGEPEILNVNLGRQAQKPVDNKGGYRTRMFYLVDVSPSMVFPSGDPDGSSKLKYVQDRILAFAKALQGEVEHIVIPYSRQVHEDSIFKASDVDVLVGRIRSIKTGMGTNIFDPVDVAVKMIEQDRNNQARNLIALISDGQITVGCSGRALHFDGQYHPGPKTQAEEDAVIGRSLRLQEIDCGAFLIGVGPEYSERLMKGILTVAKYGGMVHIPSSVNIFQGEVQSINSEGQIVKIRGILPDFINQMQTAPSYVEVSFNNRFNGGVFNDKPSIREVIEDDYRRGLEDLISHSSGEKHFPAAMGYYYEGYSVGFTDEDKLASDEAKVHLIVRDDSNGKPTVDEIPIEPFAEAILDPTERNRIENLPTVAIGYKIGEFRNVDAIREFVNSNRDSLDPNQVNSFSRLADSIESGDEQSIRGTLTDYGTSRTISDLSQVDVKKPSGEQVNDLSRLGGGPEQVNQFSQIGDSDFSGSPNQSNQDPSPQHSGGFLGPLDLKPIDVDSQGNVPPFEGAHVTHYNLAGPIANGDAPPVSGANITYSSDGKFGIEVLRGKDKINIPQGVLDKGNITLGRSSNCEIVINSSTASKVHCILNKSMIKLSIIDRGSTNGTFIKGERVTGERILQNGDIVKIADVVFKVHIK